MFKILLLIIYIILYICYFLFYKKTESIISINNKKYYFKNSFLYFKIEEKIIENNEEYKVITYDNGKKFWYNNKNEYHRLGGLPAVETKYIKEYLENNKRHRINGPAIEWSYGYNEYWIFDKYYNKQEYYEIINNPERLQNLINMEVIKEII